MTDGHTDADGEVPSTSLLSSIEGTVTDPGGHPVEDAKVDLRGVDNSANKSTYTDENGYYEFIGLVAGDYDLGAFKRGYEDVIKNNITVSSDSVKVVDFTLPFSFRKVVGETAEPEGTGVFARNTDTGSGLWAVSDSGTGVRAEGGDKALEASGKARIEAPAAGDAFNNPVVHAAVIDNTADDTSGVNASNANALAIKGGPTGAPPSEVNYVSFYDGDGDSRGAIEGNGSGGVRYKNTGSDFAEYLPKRDPDREFAAGDVVGVAGGELVADAAGADRAMVVSDQQIVLGNDPGGDAGGHEPVAFTGQVPVRVRGPVTAGDLVVPSGDGDGTARTVDPAEWNPNEEPLVGQAWERDDCEGVTEVLVAVGVDDPGVVGPSIADLRAENERLRESLTAHRDRIDALEAENERLRGSVADLRAENDRLHDRLADLADRVAAVESTGAPEATVDD